MGLFLRSTRVRAVRVLQPSAPVPQGYEDAKIAWGGIALAFSPLVVIVLVLAISAMTEEELRRPVLLLMMFVMIGILLALLGGVAPMWNVRKDQVRIARSGPLRFVSRGFGGPLQLSAALCFWVAAGLAARSRMAGSGLMISGVLGSPLSVIVLTLVGLLILGNAAYRAFEPPSLKLDEHGLWVQRLFSANLLGWEEVDRAAARLDGTVASLEIMLTRRYNIIVQQKYLGSDPRLVAEVVNYFSRQPRQRAALYDPIRALELVVEREPSPSTP